MSKVAAVFWSATGNTETMANCVAEGANGTIVPCSEMNAAKLAEYPGAARLDPRVRNLADRLAAAVKDKHFEPVAGSAQ